MTAHQKTLGLALGSHEEGKLRREHYERVAAERGYRTLSEFLREVLDRETKFNARLALMQLRQKESMVADKGTSTYKASRKRNAKPSKQKP